MGNGSACMERTGTSRSCPSGPARQVAGRHVVGQPDAVGGLVEGVAGRVHGRGVHRQDDGRLAARAHLGRGAGLVDMADVWLGERRRVVAIQKWLWYASAGVTCVLLDTELGKIT